MREDLIYMEWRRRVEKNDSMVLTQIGGEPISHPIRRFARSFFTIMSKWTGTDISWSDRRTFVSTATHIPTKGVKNMTRMSELYVPSTLFLWETQILPKVELVFNFSWSVVESLVGTFLVSWKTQLRFLCKFSLEADYKLIFDSLFLSCTPLSFYK